MKRLSNLKIALYLFGIIFIVGVPAMMMGLYATLGLLLIPQNLS
jgi:hypothetical protein